MKLSEAPRCVPFDDIKVRGNRTEACLTAMFGISNEDFLLLWFDLGVEYAEIVAQHRDSKVTALQLIRNNLYWNFWVERWLDICDCFISWRNPGKDMETFREFHLDGMPPLRIFNLLQITSQSVQTRLIASLQSPQSGDVQTPNLGVSITKPTQS